MPQPVLLGAGGMGMAWAGARARARARDEVSYLHPIVGAISLILLVYLAVLGFNARSRPRRRGELLARHARLAPYVYVLVLLSWCGGALSTTFLRGDLSFASTFHFRLGCASVALLTGSALSAQWMERYPWARELHPWFGGAAVLLAAAQAVTGLRITP